MHYPEATRPSQAPGRATFQAALAYRRAGLSIIPIARDGTKRPNGPDLPLKTDGRGEPVLDDRGRPKRTWDPFKERLPTEEEVSRWFDRPDPPGIGVIGGSVSGNLETLDFDHDAATVYPHWRELVEAERPALCDRLSVARTPGGGYHVRYRCDTEVGGNAKLAETPAANPTTGKPTKVVLIETRGAGGYALAPGSPGECHSTGRTYEHFSGPKLSQVRTITAAERDTLLRCARSFDRKAKAAKSPRDNPAGDDGLSVGDDFDRRGPSWADILTPHGWQELGRSGDEARWRRPGKDAGGLSATTGFCKGEAGEELLHVFSSNAHPLEPGTYGKFRAFALLNHRGDFAAAARELASKGYGGRPRRPHQPSADGVNGHATSGPAGGGAAPRSKPRTLDPYRAFPVEALPTPVARYVSQSAAALGCDPALVALPALAVLASVIGNSRVIRLKRGWDEPSVIWGLIVGDSGTLKSLAYLKALARLYTLQKQMRLEHKERVAEYREALAAHQAAAKRRRDEGADPGAAPEPPVYRRVLISDITIQTVAEVLEDNPRGVLVARDELAGWFGSFRQYKGKGEGSDLPNWLEMFRAGTVIVDRKTGDRRHYFVERAAVSVTGSIQPGALARAFTPEILESGGAARIVMAMPPRRPKRWSEAEVDPEVEATYHDVLDKLLALNLTTDARGERVPHALKLTPEAKAAWVAFVNSWGREQAAAEGDLAAALSKLEAYAARFALLHHVVGRVADGGDDLAPIGRESIEAGVVLCRWFAHEARRIYRVLSESVAERDARRLVEWVRGRGGRVTAKELQRANGGKYPDADAATQALDALVAAGRGRWEERPAGSKGGRPTKDFLLAADPTDATDETDETDEPPRWGGRAADETPAETADKTPNRPQGPPAKPEKRGVSSVSSVASVGSAGETDPQGPGCEGPGRGDSSGDGSGGSVGWEGDPDAGEDFEGPSWEGAS